MARHQRRTDLGGAAAVLLRCEPGRSGRTDRRHTFKSLPYWVNWSLVHWRLFVMDSSSGFGALKTDDMMIPQDLAGAPSLAETCGT